jgi:hypothetical protein
MNRAVGARARSAGARPPEHSQVPGSGAEKQPRRIQKIRHDAATEQLHIAHGGGNEKGLGYPS